MPDDVRVVESLAELTTPQIRAILKKVVIKAVCQVTAPPLDMDAINKRTEELPIDNPQRNDIYALMHEVGKLKHEAKQWHREK